MVFEPSIIPNSQKLLLTLDHTQITADQGNFPLTVILDGVANSLHTTIFTALGSNSKKFSLQSGAQQLPIEIEKWDASGQKAILHAKVPTYACSVATELILSWDAAQDDNTTYVGDIGSTVGQSVWDSNYTAVYHMSQDPTGGAGCITDSTSAARNGTTYGTMTSGDLLDGAALDFDGVDDRVVASSLYDHNAGQFCWEILVNNRSAGTDKVVLDNVSGSNWNYRTFVGFGTTGYARLFINYAGASYNLYDAIDHTNNSVHIAALRNGSNVAALYTDGVIRASNTISGDCSQAAGLTIGAGGTPSNWANCITYEVRLSSIARSADWIKLSHLSLTDQLVTWSALSVVTLTINQPISMAQIVGLSLNQPIALRKLITLGLDQSVGLELAMMLIQRCRAMPSVRLSLNQWLRDLRQVTLQLDQHFGACPQIALTLNQHLKMPFSPTLSLHQPVAIADQQIALSLVQPARLDIDGRVTLALGQPCAITTDAALLQQIGLTVTVGGRIVEPDFVSLKTDDASGYMVATIRFPDVQQYLPCRIGEEVVITELLDALPVEVTVLQVETLTNPEEHGSADHVLTAISPTVVLDDERLTDDLGPGVAATLMTAMAAGYGITLDWQGVSGWPFAAGELVAEDETAYAVLVRLAAASGAFLQSLPDGTTIRLRPEDAVNVGAWPTAATALELNDQDHIFSLDESPDERDGFNAFLVSGQSAAAGDYRLDDTEISATVKEVRCYQVPYRAASTIVLGHTGGDWVSIDYLGVHEELIKDEEVVVTAGLGRLQLPNYGGLTWSYKQDGLGTVTAEEDGSLATAQVGDALLDVSYTTRFRKWRLTDPKAESLQIYIDEVL